MATVSVRYIVHDIEAAIGFYTGHLGFSVQIHPNDMFAMLNRGDLFEPTRDEARLSRD